MCVCARACVREYVRACVLARVLTCVCVRVCAFVCGVCEVRETMILFSLDLWSNPCYQRRHSNLVLTT